MIDQADDFEHLNQIARYRNRLDDIREWRSQLHDVMLSISGFAMDLTGVRGTTDRIPGGDALAMRGPWSPDADHGDDLPHPDQVCREWMETIAGESARTWAENWRWLRDHTSDILESPWADAWRTDIDSLWGRLAALTGNSEPQPEPEPVDPATRASEIPDHTRLTLVDADRCFPGIRNRIDADRSKERARAKKEKRSPSYRCTPDRKGRYLVADLREHYGATPREQLFAESANMR